MRMCGYTSADQVCQHAKRMGSICLLPGTPYKERVMELSLDRSLLSNERCWEVIHSDRVSVDGVVEALRSLFEKTSDEGKIWRRGYTVLATLLQNTRSGAAKIGFLVKSI